MGFFFQIQKQKRNQKLNIHYQNTNSSYTQLWNLVTIPAYNLYMAPRFAAIVHFGQQYRTRGQIA